MPESRWTPARDRELALRYTAGETIDEIAVAFAMPASTVRGRVSTLGLLRRRTKRGGDSAGGNAAWVLGVALDTAFKQSDEPFASDLLARLDATSESSSR